MNKVIFALISLLLSVFLLCSCQAAATPSPSSSPSVAVGAYKDGAYTYTGKKDGEGYYVKATMVVCGGAIASMDWQILDSNSNDKVFDDQYEKIYTGNDMYVQQCRDNIKGMKGFVPRLLQVQDPGKVDTVSGATWAYNKFEEAAKALLQQAKAK